MVKGLVKSLVSRSLSVAGKWQNQQLRPLNIHEYQVPIDIFKGITDDDAAKVVDGLSPKLADRSSSIEQVKKFDKLFCECDCTLLEINPMAETSDGELVAADAKLNFDDNVSHTVPVVRREGTNVEHGKRILKESGMTPEDLDDAAQKAAEAAAK